MLALRLSVCQSVSQKGNTYVIISQFHRAPKLSSQSTDSLCLTHDRPVSLEPVGRLRSMIHSIPYAMESLSFIVDDVLTVDETCPMLCSQHSRPSLHSTLLRRQKAMMRMLRLLGVLNSNKAFYLLLDNH